MITFKEILTETKSKLMKPEEALQKMCYTSDRTWEGTIYTISDARYPEYNGKKIIVKLEKGKNVYAWTKK